MDAKYKRGRIYTIRSHKTNLVYVGSTCQKYLSSRMTGHRNDYKLYKNGGKKYCSSFEIFKIDEGCYIQLYEQYPCDNKEELEKREGEIIRELDCVNKCIAGRKIHEWRQDNKEHIKEYNKKWKENNKERVKEYHKQNYETNKENIKAKSREYHNNNKEKCNARSREYRAKHKKELNAKAKQKYQCECGGRYIKTHKARHLRTKKHQDFINNQ